MPLTPNLCDSDYSKTSFNECDENWSSVSTCSGSLSRETSFETPLAGAISESASPFPSQTNRTNHHTALQHDNDCLLPIRQIISSGVTRMQTQGMLGELAQTIALGDVLYVAGSGGLAEIGTARGFVGHFMVVVAHPQAIVAGSDEANAMTELWPAGAQEILRIPVLESTRSVAGLHTADLLIRIEKNTNHFIICGEIGTDNELFATEDEFCQIWQSPPKLRNSMRLDFVQEVVAHMRSRSGNWSIATAARALLLNARSFSSADKSELLAEIKSCWGADPICTSVVITFWQQYLCKLAGNSVDTETHPSNLIMECMPLKADRGLPGDVLRCMKDCGWKVLSNMPNPSLHSRPCDNHGSRSAATIVRPARPDNEPQQQQPLRRSVFDVVETSMELIPTNSGEVALRQSQLGTAHALFGIIPCDSGVVLPHSSEGVPSLFRDLQERTNARNQEDDAMDELTKASAENEKEETCPFESATSGLFIMRNGIYVGEA